DVYKRQLFNLAQVILNPGDLVLVPDPAYPVYEAASIIAGAEVIKLPLKQENNFLPVLDEISPEILEKAKILWLNYPNNPTGAVAPYGYLEHIIQLAHRHHFIVAFDAPYTDICFGGYKAPSILQIPGAKEVAIEFNSLSKTYNMAGWRVGMAVGNPQIIQYLHTYKSQMDSSHFQPILLAAIAALTGDQSWIEERNRIYEQRRDLVVQALKKAGFEVEPPAAAIYVWAHLPAGFEDSTAFCTRLLEDTGVSITPGIVYGTFGEGYIRISLGAPTERLQEAMERLISWLQKA
ncbi:MAG: aminotransferase class I/II-fold pyridoxal phosphate-dependent enzyme, partial [Thermanaerothrix sp.]|nr:aminotransferase class I/II-fold pyridoxal phosphate-dependent enzyme [Thermanaerothrix sp.]